MVDSHQLEMLKQIKIPNLTEKVTYLAGGSGLTNLRGPNGIFSVSQYVFGSTILQTVDHKIQVFKFKYLNKR